MAKLARLTPETPDPVVLKSAKKTLSVFGVEELQTDHKALLRGAVTTVFLKITLITKRISVSWPRIYFSRLT